MVQMHWKEGAIVNKEIEQAIMELKQAEQNFQYADTEFIDIATMQLFASKIKVEALLALRKRDVPLKKCAKCKNEYPSTKEFFYKHTFNEDGLTGTCKKCAAAYKRDYRTKNKEKDLMSKRKYAQIHKNEKLESDKKYRESNRKELNIKAKMRYINPIVKLVSSINYHKRYARKNSLVVDFEVDDWKSSLDYFGNSCAYCGKTNSRLEQEHFIPKSKGGNYVKNNIIPACRSCNSGKKDNNFYTWYKIQPFYSQGRERKILNFVNKGKKESPLQKDFLETKTINKIFNNILPQPEQTVKREIEVEVVNSASNKEKHLMAIGKNF